VDFEQAMYPTLVMVLVHSHRTFDQLYFINPSLPPISLSASGGHGNIMGPIAFALPNNASSTGILPESAETKDDPPTSIGQLGAGSE
jgi:hypothetical protein